MTLTRLGGCLDADVQSDDAFTGRYIMTEKGFSREMEHHMDTIRCL